MKPNDQTRNFELDPIEREALGKDTPDTWPFDDVVGLLSRAQLRQQAVSDWDLSEFPKGDRHSYMEQQQWKFNGHLLTLIGQLTDYLPSTAEGAEQFLREQE